MKTKPNVYLISSVLRHNISSKFNSMNVHNQKLCVVSLDYFHVVKFLDWLLMFLCRFVCSKFSCRCFCVDFLW